MPKVLLISDSPIFKDKLKKHLNMQRSMTVLNSLPDLRYALDMMNKLRPDIVLVDMQVQVNELISFIDKVNTVNLGIATVVFTELRAEVFSGAESIYVKIIKKPASPVALCDIRFLDEIVKQISIMSTLKLGRYKSTLSGNTVLHTSTGPTINSTDVYANVSDKIVIAIGASTGGTEATVEVLKNLPSSTPGIVLVQHMPRAFTKMYAERLNKVCKMSAKEAEDGDRVKRGLIILAQGEKHMRLHRDVFGYFISSREGERVSGHCPSVDVLFHSVADTAKNCAVGVILTGMGADGAKGMLEMRKSGAYTIGQDRATSVVYGMPMVAYNSGAVKVQLPLNKISSEILKAVLEKNNTI